MEHLRHILLGALIFVGFLLWNAWQKDYPANPAKPAATAAPQTPAALPAPGALPAVPSAPAATASSTSTMATPIPVDRLIHITTDALQVTIDKQGGQIIQVKLPQYPAKQNQPNEPFTLLNNSPDTLYVAESGLVGQNGPDTTLHAGQYTTPQNQYQLTEGQETLTVPLAWENKEGLKIIKTFTFKRGEYLIKVGYEVNNQSPTPWTGYFYAQLKRKEVPQETSMFQINPYMGGAISSPAKRYEKVSFDTMKKENLNQSIQEGWAAFLQHYFLSAWIPDSKQTFQYSTQALPDKVYLMRLVGPAMQVPAGRQASTEAKFYAGPSVANILKPIAPGLDLVVDYGILWMIGTALFWVMNGIYQFIGNWGWAIVLVTVCVKLIFYPLSAASYRSMAAMRKLHPRLLSLKERYGDDRQKLSQATMELYKKEKINPLGGCLPVLVQIPVFIALYWVLLESVELRQAPFILWIKDLSVQDPYYILPIIMGLTMFLQQRLNPTPVDPVQAKVMMFLPVVFTALFLSFPAGLVLYWVVNNSLSILQQWYVTQKVEKAPKTGQLMKR